jgi:hypothetical protein
MEVGSAAQRFDDLEGRCLLSLDAKGVDRVDEGDGVVGGHFFRKPERGVEVAFDLDHARSVDHCLGELAERDVALRNENRAHEARAAGVCGG